MFFITGTLPICPHVQDICAWKEFARLKPEWSLLGDHYIGDCGQKSGIIPFYRMRVICSLPSNSLIDWFYFSFGNVWCNLWVVFLISHSHRLVIFILEFHFLCLEATMLGMCYIAKQLRNRIHKLNLTCYTFHLGAFCYVWLGYTPCFCISSSDTATTYGQHCCLPGASCKHRHHIFHSHTHFLSFADDCSRCRW